MSLTIYVPEGLRPESGDMRIQFREGAKGISAMLENDRREVPQWCVSERKWDSVCGLARLDPDLTRKRWQGLAAAHQRGAFADRYQCTADWKYIFTSFGGRVLQVDFGRGQFYKSWCSSKSHDPVEFIADLLGLSYTDAEIYCDDFAGLDPNWAALK